MAPRLNLLLTGTAAVPEACDEATLPFKIYLLFNEYHVFYRCTLSVYILFFNFFQLYNSFYLLLLCTLSFRSFFSAPAMGC